MSGPVQLDPKEIEAIQAWVKDRKKYSQEQSSFWGPRLVVRDGKLQYTKLTWNEWWDAKWHRTGGASLPQIYKHLKAKNIVVVELEKVIEKYNKNRKKEVQKISVPDDFTNAIGDVKKVSQKIEDRKLKDLSSITKYESVVDEQGKTFLQVALQAGNKAVVQKYMDGGKIKSLSYEDIHALVSCPQENRKAIENLLKPLLEISYEDTSEECFVRRDLEVAKWLQQQIREKNLQITSPLDHVLANAPKWLEFGNGLIESLPESLQKDEARWKLNNFLTPSAENETGLKFLKTFVENCINQEKFDKVSELLKEGLTRTEVKIVIDVMGTAPKQFEKILQKFEAVNTQVKERGLELKIHPAQRLQMAFLLELLERKSPDFNQFKTLLSKFDLGFSAIDLLVEKMNEIPHLKIQKIAITYEKIKNRFSSKQSALRAAVLQLEGVLVDTITRKAFDKFQEQHGSQARLMELFRKETGDFYAASTQQLTPVGIKKTYEAAQFTSNGNFSKRLAYYEAADKRDTAVIERGVSITSKHVKEPTILQMHKVSYGDKVGAFAEYYDQLDLRTRIDKMDKNELQKPETLLTHLKIFRDVLQGVTAMHKQDQFHGGLRIPSILIREDETGALRGTVSDFEFSKQMKPGQKDIHPSRKFYGNPLNTPPESVQDKSADLWALGCMLKMILEPGKLVPWYFQSSFGWNFRSKLTKQAKMPEEFADDTNKKELYKIINDLLGIKPDSTKPNGVDIDPTNRLSAEKASERLDVIIDRLQKSLPA